VSVPLLYINLLITSSPSQTISSTIEIQTFISVLLLHFRFSIPPSIDSPGKRVIRAATGVMAPTVEGELAKGKQLPLIVEVLDSEE
jgi:hypothetical protein